MQPDSVSSVADETSPWELRLYTERLCLRAPTSQDAEDLYDLARSFSRPWQRTGRWWAKLGS